ncbi:HET-domain-containing protein [Coniochaeta hoffmannii]|uniref:HET-domain-containing protein n=1 Tax=Coniochaeta hoffmannii TaxID=91930 RepID=A0AA38W2M0_9PEZI|nr:HET-domain-containing protein [Coniochaeta hoffmannii]
MWLINTKTEKIQFVADPELHQYAILSHTWRRDGEPTFQDYKDYKNSQATSTSPSARRTVAAGRVIKDERFAKVRETCRLARARNIPFVWVDNVCIDKSSSAELTEAINSMFRWYKNAAVCFAYLADLPAGPKKNLQQALSLCHWFTRGWTLQELVASRVVEFYDEAWNLRGDKHELCELVSSITRIDEDVLRDSSLLRNIPVARRMSWASTRQCTRVEDVAYSLLGIFDIHMPLIYGEGDKAFIRLQEAIAQDTTDLSLFAWTSRDSTYKRQNYHGLFARSPVDFLNCDRLLRILSPVTLTEEYAITNKGIRLTARMNEGESPSGEKDFLLNLDCLDSSRQQPDGMHSIVFIRLVRTPHGFVRHWAGLPVLVSASSVQPSAPRTIYVPKTIGAGESRDLVMRLSQRFHVDIDNRTGFVISYTRQYPAHLWEPERRAFMTDGNERFIGILHLRFQGGYVAEPVEHHDPEFPPVDQEGGPNNFWWPSLWLVFGLRKQDRAGDSPPTTPPIPSAAGPGDFQQHQPWAVIYDRETAKDFTKFMEREAGYGIGHVLEQVAAFVRQQGSGDKSGGSSGGPSSSETALNPPEASSSSAGTVVAPYVPGKKRIFNEYAVRLRISTTVEVDRRGTWGYKLGIEAERIGLPT